jgi:hypothetical protein
MNQVTSTSNTTTHAEPSGGILLPISWLIVGVPLLWGVWETLKKSLALFQ